SAASPIGANSTYARRKLPAPARSGCRATTRRRTVTVRVGVNGFGRIGRNFWRAVRASGQDIEVVAFNDLGDVPTMAHLLKYDSVLGRLSEDVKVTDEGIQVGGKTIRALAERDP